MFFRTVPEHKMRLPTAEEALPGRAEPVVTSEIHAVLGTRIQPPFPADLQQLVVGMGCFWGAERLFWQLDGVYSTAVGYSAGLTPNPTYEEVCSGLTGHNEVVLVVFDPERLPLEELLRVFWENHDPTLGVRQGYGLGALLGAGGVAAGALLGAEVEASRAQYADALQAAGLGPI